MDRPMIERVRETVPTPNSPIVAPDMGNGFKINGSHLQMIQGKLFDGGMRADPHRHITEFSSDCQLFQYGNTEMDVVKLMFFP